MPNYLEQLPVNNDTTPVIILPRKLGKIGILEVDIGGAMNPEDYKARFASWAWEKRLLGVNHENVLFNRK